MDDINDREPGRVTAIRLSQLLYIRNRTMPFILLAIIAVAAIVVSGMFAVHGPTVVTGESITTASAGLSMLSWLLVIAAIGLVGWWLHRRRKP